MSKNITPKLLVFTFVFFCLLMNVYAGAKYVVLLDGVNIRTGPDTSYSIKVVGSVGSTFYLKNDTLINDTSGACPSGWYEINYQGESAYVCSNYVRVSADDASTSPSTTCESEMAAAGFPGSYWPGLCSLKEKHPNWTFKALMTNLDWKTAVEKESACGRSKISTNDSSFIDTSCYANEGSFRAASKTAVAFYMDPRNFFTENYIFQFEYLRYEAALESAYTSAISKMLSPAAFYKYHVNNNINFASLTTEAGKEMNINPISLASRMYQELGTGTSLYNLYSGVYGYYNFYNIGVNSSCVSNITNCGINYAKASGWDTPYNGIKGGASLLSNSYLSKGQYTAYLQKFNVTPTDPTQLYIHQYMTNIAAPSSEGNTTYRTYYNMGLLDSAFAFYIPVYMNMSATISNSGSGATNDDTSSSLTTTSISSIITTAGYKINNSYLMGVLPNSDLATLKGNLEAIAGSGNVTITNANGNPMTQGLIGTGNKVTIKNSTESKTYTVVIKGDTSGDGVINSLDLLQVRRNILGTFTFNGAYKEAADTSRDGIVGALDLLHIQRSILGTYDIPQ